METKEQRAQASRDFWERTYIAALSAVLRAGHHSGDAIIVAENSANQALNLWLKKF